MSRDVLTAGAWLVGPVSTVVVEVAEPRLVDAVAVVALELIVSAHRRV